MDSMSGMTNEKRAEWADNPRWDEATQVHDWRNYVLDDVKLLWAVFSYETRINIIRHADEYAMREEWD